MLLYNSGYGKAAVLISPSGFVLEPLLRTTLGSFPHFPSPTPFPWSLPSLQPQLPGSRALRRHCRLGNPEGGFNLLSPQRGRAGPEPGRGRGQGTWLAQHRACREVNRPLVCCRPKEKGETRNVMGVIVLSVLQADHQGRYGQLRDQEWDRRKKA